jgi:2-C-methyl-D-erythritol 4-phosphate cytidylyltransferase
MGASLPKQYLPLGNKTLLEHTLERLLQLPMMESLLLVLHPQDSQWQQLALSHDSRIQVIIGGDERSDSVLNALHSLVPTAAENDWVLVHDAARPCVTLATIQELCKQVNDHSVGGILGVPVSDTLKSVSTDQTICSTVDRSHLWQAQTPQMFRYGLLRSCLTRAAQEKKVITDEASALEVYGYAPLMVNGRSDNIKITHPEDLLLAQWILQRQEEHKQAEHL